MITAKTVLIALLSAAMIATAIGAFAGGKTEGTSAGSSTKMESAMAGGGLLGAGASFPFPIYSKMADEYNKLTGTKVNYQSIGSSGGVKNIKDKVVDFGASDAYLSDEQLAGFDAQVIQFPTVAGAIVITYNLPGKPTLTLTGPVAADIFLGKITKWNDPAITALNAGITLPGDRIVVAHRSDGSGTTFNFTLYLSRVSAEWKDSVGNANSVSWPVGLGGAQNAGVAGIVTGTPGSVGYVELAYATQNGLPYATLKNKSGKAVVASLSSTSAAADTSIPADGRIYLVDTDAANGYPVATLTWLIAYKEQNYGGRTLEQARRLVDYLWWVVHDGQQYAEALEYAKLPAAAVKVDETIIRSITYDGKPVLNK